MVWSRDEDAILCEEMEGGRGWQGRAAARLPNRTRGAVQARAYRLELTIHRIKPWFPPQEKGRLRPGQAQVAHSRRRQAMQHHR
jgi:hypothetical protein